MHVLMTDKFSGSEKIVIEIIKNMYNSGEMEFVYFAKQGPIE